MLKINRNGLIFIHNKIQVKAITVRKNYLLATYKIDSHQPENYNIDNLHKSYQARINTIYSLNTTHYTPYDLAEGTT